MANRQIWELTAEASPSTTFVLPIQKADGSVEAEKITIGTLLGLLPSGSVTLAKMADIATDRLIGRDTTGTGVPEALTVGGGVEFTGSGGIQRSALTGAITASAGSNTTALAADAVTTAKILDDNVTYAKIQNVSATDRLLGRDTASAGDIEELTVSGGLEFTGSTGIQRSALTGDVTASAGSNSTSIASNAVVTAKIADANVTLAKIANIGTDRLLGRDTASSGVTEELTVGGGISFSGSGGITLDSTLTSNARVAVNKNSGATVGTRRRLNFIEGTNVTLTIADDSGNEEVDITIAASGGGGGVSDGDKGDITVSSTGAVWTVDNDAITYAKIQNVSATDRLLGRDTAAAGDIEELTVGGGIEFTGSTGIQRSALTGDVTASAGSNSTTIAANAVTLAKFVQATAQYKLLGRVSASAGNFEEVTSTANVFSILQAADYAAIRTLLGLVIGTNVQAQDAELAALAGLTSAADSLPYFTGSGTAALATFTTAGRALVDDADATAQRATLGLGTIATQAANNVTISGGSVTGITDLAVADGGTGSSTAAAARTALGLDKRVIAQWDASQLVPAQTNGPAIYVRTGTDANPESHLGFAFDATTDEEGDLPGQVPGWFPASTGMKLTAFCLSDATSGNFVFQASLFRLTVDLDGNFAYSYQSSGAVATSGTAGIMTKFTISFSSSQIDSLVAGDPFRIRIRRDADNTSATDSITGNDVVLIGGIILEEA